MPYANCIRRAMQTVPRRKRIENNNKQRGLLVADLRFHVVQAGGNVIERKAGRLCEATKPVGSKAGTLLSARIVHGCHKRYESKSQDGIFMCVSRETIRIPMADMR